MAMVMKQEDDDYVWFHNQKGLRGEPGFEESWCRYPAGPVRQEEPQPNTALPSSGVATVDPYMLALDAEALCPCLCPCQCHI